MTVVDTLAVESEDQKSWPAEFLAGAIQNRDLILSYHRQKLRIDRKARNDVSARINPPENRHKTAYRRLVAHLEPILTAHRIVGYHCTRLTPDEISSVGTQGLQILSASLVERRLDAAFSRGYLKQEHHQYLKNSEHIRASLRNKHGNRTGMLWFCPNRSTLCERFDVYRFFRSWGGEAVYWPHEEDNNVSHILFTIGTPCVVKCAIPFAQAEPFHENFSERFLSQFVSDEIEHLDPAPGFDLCTDENVSARDVLEIVEFSDPRFESLTGCSTWGADYSINLRDE